MADLPDKTQGLIFKQIPKAAKLIGPVLKKQTNEGIKYEFRGVDDVYNAVHGPFADTGIFPTQKIIEEKIERRPTKNQYGKDVLMTCVYTHRRYYFWAEDGSHVETEGSADSWDYSDKAVGKASSMAYKDAVIKQFNLPVKESDADKETPTIYGIDQDEKDPPKNAKTEQQQPTQSTNQQTDQIKQIRDTLAKEASKYFAQLGMTVKNVKQAWLKEQFNCEPQDMTIANWESAIFLLQQKLKGS